MADAAVFLDRDGTLIDEVGFASRPEQIRILGGAARALADLARAGYRLIVVTNQSGLARGLLTEEALERFHEALDAQLDMLGVHLDAYYVCPHHPDLRDSPRPDLVVECQCRKPKPGLILRAADDFDIDLAASWMVGDTWRDIAAGQAAGVKTIKVPADADHDFARPPHVEPPTAEADSLAGAARIILGIPDAEPDVADTGPETEAEQVETPPDTVAEEPTSAEEPEPEEAGELVQVEDVEETEAPDDVAAADAVEEAAARETPDEPQPETPLEARGMPSEDAPPPATAAGVCARCGQDVRESDLADGGAGERDGLLLCAECLALQPRETARGPPGSETNLLRSILVEMRQLNRAQRASAVTWLRLLAYVVQAGALFCGMVLGLVGDDKALYFQIAMFLQLVVIALLLFERKP
ncbi:MAG TPA: HAD family hydrolase [Phycisphaerae bacterium]|nr:HAD family hydrolase [Phycisphaerae bacterium]